MPVPTGFDNKVRVTTDDATALNAEVATQNAADYLLFSVAFDGAGTALLLFGKNAGAAYVPTAPQKVNAVAATQGAVDADAATESADGYVPTGIFTNGTTAYVLYQQLDDSDL